MAKKLTLALAVIILSFCCGVCFAEENNSNMNLGDEISNTFNDVENGVENIANDVMSGEVTTDYNRNNGIDTNTDRDYLINSTTNNGYNAYRTTTDGTTTTDTMMSTTTWMWIILAIAAIVIIAMIWYYAVQGNDNHRE